MLAFASWSLLRLFAVPVLAMFAAEPSDAATGKLMVRVVDAETGRPMPARLVLRASDGTYPGDRLNASADRWPHIEAHGIFIAGEATFELPPGTTSVTAARGLEYRATRQVVELLPDQTQSIELRLERAVDMRKAGWVAGDLHVHMIHGENQRPTSYEDVALTCAASGLDFVSVGQEYVGAGRLDLAGYHAACRAASHNGFQMFLGGERPKNILGHQVMLGVENPFLVPESPPYFNVANAVHASGGVLVYVHPIRYFPGKQWGGDWLDFPGNNLARELIFDSFAGPSFDGLSVLSDEPAHPDAHRLWFNLLNRGCFVPVFADSDACFDRPAFGLKAPGLWSTYFQIGSDTPVTPQAIADAVRGGRTMATTGPLVQFQIDGHISGATLPNDGMRRTLSIDAHYPQHAFSLDTIDPETNEPVGIARIELIRNGSVVEHWEPAANQIRITHTIAEAQPCWYAVRAYGSDDRWQVALTSPIYFASQPVPQKGEPLSVVVRGRIYDFETGSERSAEVEIQRNQSVLRRFRAEGQFRVKMPIDAEIVVRSDARPLRKNLLMDFGPVHRFLWYLESADLGSDETFERFQHLVREVDLEFPLGYRMSGSYFARDLTHAQTLGDVRVVAGPERIHSGTVAVAAILLDAEQIAPGDAVNVAVVFRDEGDAAQLGPYVIEARGYDPRRPTAFEPLKKFASVERSWEAAVDLGDGCRLVSGSLPVPAWVEPGPSGIIDISVRVRQGNGDATSVGLALPLGATKRSVSLSNSWPTMPLSWPDRQYGIGPLKLCNRLGRKGSAVSDYRQLQLRVGLADETLDLLAARDARGAADADDAFYMEHYHDQVLAEESQLAQPPIARPQPDIAWRADLPLVDATRQVDCHRDLVPHSP